MKGVKDKALVGSSTQTALITGGAGFVGSNLAQRLLEETSLRVRILDNLSRRGVEHNGAWLRTLRGASRLEIVEGDVRDARIVTEAMRDATEVYHLAAQVAVTTSIDEPETDFDTNAAGTFRVLEAARRSPSKPFLLFTSTNKVYGSLEGVPVQPRETRHAAIDPSFSGVDESEHLDFHSPYGCSKGTADQYVLDYGKCYDIPTAVLRMSCIYGPRQFGTEDQGWVAHFLIQSLRDRPITLYGDGKQVRDILHVRDAVEAYRRVLNGIDRLRGRALNLGGGARNAVSLRELLREIGDQRGRPVPYSREPGRQGDQPFFVADTGALERDSGWRARTPWREGVRELSDWLARHRVPHPLPDRMPLPA